MIITRTPFRISFFGGGTDYPAWYRRHGGAVLSTTIDKYCFITCRYLPAFFEHKHRIVYSKIESVREFEEIQHPAVRELLKYMNIDKGLEIHHDGDLPARSGLGSSSSFSTGLLLALRSLIGQAVQKQDLAREIIHLEQNIIGEHVGSQDQVAASFGGFNRIDFFRDDLFEVTPVITSATRLRELHSHLLLFYTGVSRIASEIAESKIKNVDKKQAELRAMYSMVEQAERILADTSQPIERFGELLDEAWQYKRALSDRVSNDQIEEIYKVIKSKGAIGGKILGAGGGGFFLVFAHPKRHAEICESLKHLIHVPFEFENSGARVVLYQPQGL